jgi:hypothetical protein
LNHPIVEPRYGPAAGGHEQTREYGMNEAGKSGPKKFEREGGGDEKMLAVGFADAARVGEEESVDHGMSSLIRGEGDHSVEPRSGCSKEYR